MYSFNSCESRISLIHTPLALADYDLYLSSNFVGEHNMDGVHWLYVAFKWALGIESVKIGRDPKDK